MAFTNYNPEDRDEGKPFNYSPEAGCRLPNGDANIPEYSEQDAVRDRSELARRVKEDLGI